jgi:hypothetical protein
MKYGKYVVVIRGEGTVHHIEVIAISAEAAEADVMAAYDAEIIQSYARG